MLPAHCKERAQGKAITTLTAINWRPVKTLMLRTPLYVLAIRHYGSIRCDAPISSTTCSRGVSALLVLCLTAQRFDFRERQRGC
jgi:hypothetical protein